MSADKLQMYLDPEKRTFMFDYSTMSVACDRQLYWSRFQQIKKKRPNEAAFFGKAIHKFVEHFWLGKGLDECLAAFYSIARAEDSPLIDDPTDDSLRNVQRGFTVCTFYYRHYNPLRATVKPYILNGVPLVEVPFAFPLGHDNDDWTYLYCGKIDRIELRDDKFVWIPDTKTTTRFGSKYWNVLRPNDQITGYNAAVKELTGIIPHFSGIDVIALGTPRKTCPKDIQAQGQVAIEEYLANVRFEQGPTTRSPEDISDWWDNALTEGMRMRKLWTAQSADNKMLWTKRTSQCGNFGGCEFRDLCQVHGGLEPILDTIYEKNLWTPFEEETVVEGA